MIPRSISRYLCLTLLVTPGLLRAQNGSIGGKITDSTTSAPLSGATVRVASGSTTAGSAVAGEDGTYRVANIAPGTYDVLVTRLGYSLRRIPGVRITAGGNTTLDLRMAEIVLQLN